MSPATRPPAPYIAIVGSRDYMHREKIREVVHWIASRAPEAIIVSGGARGVDSLAEAAAYECHLRCVVYPADWERYGKKAGFIRNKDIIAAADRVIGFWDGVSKGTAHSLRLARSTGKPLSVFGPEGVRLSDAQLDMLL